MSLNLIALIEIVDNIYTNIDSSNDTVGVFLDLWKAFDTVDRNFIVQIVQVWCSWCNFV